MARTGIKLETSPAEITLLSPSQLDRICISTSHDFACSTPKGRTQDVFETIVKGRKSWKTLRGNGEAVWPPQLEAALLEGTYSLPLQ